MLTQLLKNKVRNELERDLSRYDGDYPEWSRVVFDCPSNSLEQLMGECPEEDEDELNDYISTVVEELEPSDEEE